MIVVFNQASPNADLIWTCVHLVQARTYFQGCSIRNGSQSLAKALFGWKVMVPYCQTDGDAIGIPRYVTIDGKLWTKQSLYLLDLKEVIAIRI